MNPFLTYVDELARITKQLGSVPLGTAPEIPKPPIADDAPNCLVFSPHPDDEVIIGGLPLRLMREAGWRVENVAVTLGSNRDRQAERMRELEACCRCVGFELVATCETGIEKVNARTRQDDPDHWKAGVARIAEILADRNPNAIFFPHDDDWNSTHIGVHHLVVDALATLPGDFQCHTFETEFWGAMDDPNLMVESSRSDVADLLAALTHHIGEVERNPYHLRVAPWMMDNVRRGCELVGSQGGGSPDFLFATLYRLREWREGGFKPVLKEGVFLGADKNAASIIA